MQDIRLQKASGGRDSQPSSSVVPEEGTKTWLSIKTDIIHSCSQTGNFGGAAEIHTDGQTLYRSVDRKAMKHLIEERYKESSRWKTKKMLFLYEHTAGGKN